MYHCICSKETPLSSKSEERERESCVSSLLISEHGQMIVCPENLPSLKT